MAKNSKTILWALDPFHGSQSEHLRAALMVENIARVIGAKIEPVYILSPNTYYLPTDYFVPPSTTDFIYTAQTELNKILDKIRSDYLLPPKIIYAEAYSLRNTVKTFVEYAKERRAVAIFSPTHARKGLPRFWLGSFTETLLIYSQIPILSINPNAKNKFRIQNVLWPTDLSKTSFEALKAFLPIARAINTKLHLLHVVQSYGLAAALASEGLSDVAYNYYYKEIKKIHREKQKRIQSWAALCKRKGVTTSTDIIDSQAPILETVLKVARKIKANLIAMASTSGPIENIMTGGISRQVVRFAECPVWVMHQFSKGRPKK